jgi:hypothetical protein
MSLGEITVEKMSLSYNIELSLRYLFAGGEVVDLNTLLRVNNSSSKGTGRNVIV